MKVIVERADCLFYFIHPYKCKFFMQYLQVGGISLSVNQAIYFIAGIF